MRAGQAWLRVARGNRKKGTRADVKRRIISRASALALALAAVCGAPLSAQEAFLQIEAHATRNAAAQFASGYASLFDDVVGYRLPRTGWHVIALGPFEDAAEA